jgi:hypothetical protein
MAEQADSLHMQSYRTQFPHLAYSLFNGWVAGEKSWTSEIFNDPETPSLVLVFITCYGVFMSVLFLRLLTAQLSTSYASLLKETHGFAILSAASFVLQLEAGLAQQGRMKFYEELGFGNRLPFDTMDLGVQGGVQVMEPLHKWPIVEQDRVMRFTGAAGMDEPWPVPHADITLEERLIGIDTRIRQTMGAFESRLFNGAGAARGSLRMSRGSLTRAHGTLKKQGSTMSNNGQHGGHGNQRRAKDKKAAQQNSFDAKGKKKSLKQQFTRDENV